MNIFNNGLVDNSNELYRKYFNNKNRQSVNHYTTASFPNVTDKAIEDLSVSYYSWRAGDTWEKVATQFRIDRKEWKLLALINSAPMSIFIIPGTTVIIPENMSAVRALLGTR